MSEPNTIYIHMSGGVITSVSAKDPDAFPDLKVVLVRNQASTVDVEYHPANDANPITPVKLTPMSLLKLGGEYVRTKGSPNE